MTSLDELKKPPAPSVWAMRYIELEMPGGQVAFWDWGRVLHLAVGDTFTLECAAVTVNGVKLPSKVIFTGPAAVSTEAGVFAPRVTRPSGFELPTADWRGKGRTRH